MKSKEYEGSNRGWWARRSDFASMSKLLAIAVSCEPGAKANFLTHHIGIRLNGRPYNYFGVKGSSRASFSIEIKIGKDRAAKKALESHAGWHVDQHDPRTGYRTHLPEALSDADVAFLRPFIKRSHKEWTERRAPPREKRTQ